MDRKYYNSLNIFRIGGAVCICCFMHYASIFSTMPGFENHIIINGICKYAGLLTEMFFMISGFVNHASFIYKSSKGRIGFLDYFKGKIKRLYPLMIVSILLITVVQYISLYKYGIPVVYDYSLERNKWYFVLLNILGVSSGWFSNLDDYCINGPTWYICTLIIIYLIYYFINRIPSNTVRRIIYVIMCLVGIVSIYVSLNTNIRIPLLYQSCGRGYFSFFLGVLLFEIVSLKRFNKTISIIVPFVVIIMCVLLWKDAYMFYIAPLIEISFVCIFINCNFLEKIGGTKLFKYLGKISYPIYLFNIPVFAWILFVINNSNLDINYDTVSVYIIINLALVLLSIIVEFVYEKIIKKLKSRKSCGE